MRLCIFYDAQGPNGAQFAINPKDVRRVDGDDGADGSEPIAETFEGGEVRITLKDGSLLYPCGEFATVVRVLEGEPDLRSWDLPEEDN